MYNISGMTDKNKDALIKDLLDLVAASSNEFLQTLFPDRPDPNSKKRPPTAGDRIKVCSEWPSIRQLMTDLATGVRWRSCREPHEGSAVVYPNNKAESESQRH